MSVPFTVYGGNLQIGAEELRLAVSERENLSNSSLSFWKKFIYSGSWKWVNGSGGDEDKLGTGANIQAYTFWYGFQTLIEGMLRDYMEYEEGVTLDGLSFSEADALRFLSFKQFCEYVGSPLWVSDTDYGWPRSNSKDEDGEFIMERGQHQNGDYIGPWLVEAHVAACTAIKATKKNSTASRFHASSEVLVYRGKGATQAAALAAAKLDTPTELPSLYTKQGSTIVFLPELDEWRCTYTTYSMYLTWQPPNIGQLELYDGSDLTYEGPFVADWPYTGQPEGTLVDYGACREIADFTNEGTS